MITYLKDKNILKNIESGDVLINTVNTIGVMGKGLALEFKKMFPANFSKYQVYCLEGKFKVGTLFTVQDKISDKDVTIINFPTKREWYYRSEYSYIEKGLDALHQQILDNKYDTSIKIPKLGCKNGGLDWKIVRKMIEDKLSDLDANIIIYE